MPSSGEHARKAMDAAFGEGWRPAEGRVHRWRTLGEREAAHEWQLTETVERRFRSSEPVSAHHRRSADRADQMS